MPEPFPLQLLLATFARWVNRHQAEVILGSYVGVVREATPLPRGKL